ncbi:uncharacterized protein LOC135103075 [Scylla paramamosain]|uniref:uncharacterized protein LOC135103075 n=1 Tax=Scylla paramamosain TaxID=85552 RepID=UPI0030827B68
MFYRECGGKRETVVVVAVWACVAWAGVGGGNGRRRAGGAGREAPQYTGARDSDGMLLPLSRVALLLAALLASCRAANVTTPEPTTSSEATTVATTTTQEKQEDVSVTTTETPSTTPKITADNVLEEVSHLLEKLREVAASMREAREEHERLAEAVAQVTAAVKDMGEHNLHIKKKVRKMSKGLKKNSHNKKIKDGIKSLQRDHQRILHAMSLSGINITRLHNHTRKHNLTHPRPNHKNQHGRNRKNHNNNAATTTTTPLPENATKSPDQKALEEEVEGEVIKEALTEKRKDGEDEVGGSTDNLIPELVVDPPSATDPPLPADCTEVMQRGNWTSGVYLVQPQGLQPIKVGHIYTHTHTYPPTHPPNPPTHTHISRVPP